MRLGFFRTQLRILLFGVVDAWLAIWPARKLKAGVALIRLDAIGDFTLWLDSAKEYRDLYAGEHIVLLANVAWADWASKFPHWDEVWAVDPVKLRRHFVYRAKILRAVRRAGFKVIIQPTYSRTFDGDSLVRASAAPQRIGSIGDDSNITAAERDHGDRWYTQLVPASDQSLMELERNAEFIRNLSGRPYQADLPRITESCLSAAVRPWPSGYVVLFPGASWYGRRWPLASFAELASRLYAERGWPFVLCGGPGDWPICERLGARLTVPFVNWAGKTNLGELAGVIYHARVLISNETSAVHIAAAVKTAAICVVGGGHYGRFLPYPSYFRGIKPLVADHPMPCFNCNWRCFLKLEKLGPVPCIERISVERVLELTRELALSDV
jgi:ADP-heptose:LPS heptosyltransferase